VSGFLVSLATTTVWPTRTLPCPCPARCLCWHPVTKNMPLARSRNYSQQSALCDGARKCVTAKGMSARSRSRRAAVVQVRPHQFEWRSSQRSGQLSNGACARLRFTALDAGDGSGTQASKRSKFALGQSGLHAASAEPTEMNHGRASRSYSGVGRGSRARLLDVVDSPHYLERTLDSHYVDITKSRSCTRLAVVGSRSGVPLRRRGAERRDRE